MLTGIAGTARRVIAIMAPTAHPQAAGHRSGWWRLAAQSRSMYWNYCTR